MLVTCIYTNYKSHVQLSELAKNRAGIDFMLTPPPTREEIAETILKRSTRSDLGLDEMRGKLVVENLSAGFGSKKVLEDISVPFKDNTVTAIIGPSGCGKSTFIRCLNRMHEVSNGAWTKGHVSLDDEDMYSPDINPVKVRRKIGLVFQKPNPFPTMSVYDNVAAGLRLNGVHNEKLLGTKVQENLIQAFLWEEVRDRLGDSGASLSGGQQQRLCIARALAVEPEVVLMDEPCSALDPVATAK